VPISDQDQKPATKKIDCVAKGEKLVVLDENGPWYNVRLPNGNKGWIHKNLTSK